MFKFGSCTLRAVEEEDLKFLWEMRRDEVILDNIFQTLPISMSTQKNWLEAMLKDPKNKVLLVDQAFEKGTKTIGCVRLTDIDHVNRKVEIGADIHASFRGQKLAFGLYRALVTYCFEYLNMNKLYLYVMDKNVIAVKLYKKIGFSVEGRLQEHIFKHGKYQDIFLMSLFRGMI